MVQVLHSIFYVLALVTSTSSFAVQPGFRQSLTRSYLFSTDEGSSASSTPSPARALETVVDGEDVSSGVVAAATGVTEEKNFVRNMNTGEIIEVKWKDPAMEAHTNPFEMSWWAYPLCFGPFVLLADDAAGRPLQTWFQNLDLF